jgi:hypothetical protein
MTTLNKIQALTEVSGNAKIDLLKTFKDDEVLKAAFEAAYNPNHNFWVIEFPDLGHKKQNPSVTIEDAIAHIKTIKSRSTEALTGLAELAVLMTQSDEEVLRMILRRDLRCGVSAGTINKVWPKLIPEYPVMLCRVADEKNRKHITFPAFVQTKMDGMRVNIHVTKDAVEVFTRNGKPVTTHGVFDHLTELTLDDTGEAVSIVIDGELVFDFEQNGVLGVHDRKTGNGLGNKAVRGTISPEEASGMVVVAWDIIPLNEFKKGFFDYAYDFRFQILEEKQTQLTTSRLRIVKSVVAVNWEEVNAAFAAHLEAGEEGVIVKNFSAPWEDNRSKHMQKLKAEKEAELRIVGGLPGKGKFEGMVGSLLMETDDGRISVGVSGMSDATRKEITENFDEYVDRIATVRYNEVIQSKGKEKASLFLPRLVSFRPDKNETNRYEDF